MNPFTTLTTVMLLLTTSPVSAGEKKSLDEFLYDANVGDVIHCEPIDDPSTPSEARLCPRGLVSYSQPDDSRLAGSGKCGSVGVSNILHNVCGIETSPASHGRYLKKRPGEGAHGGELEKVLNDLTYDRRDNHCTRFHWENDRQDPWNYWEREQNPKKESLEWRVKPFSDQRRRGIFWNPAIVALSVPNSSEPGHWTTVVEVTDDYIVHLSWGKLFKTKVETFRYLQAAHGDIVYLEHLSGS